ncbi:MULTISPECIES: electron transport complex subunit RsxA [Tissierella]|uniref:Ion-translocating oxidoreductase complex subunit A n=1 Tax=Tissierella praeacuta DSM 18095 TaxID=1123404 RepID=A0A1M4S6C6_9FIRM|nr:MULTISPECIES: electron transport complex subunit RsxA [Tissierella]MBU5256733.1 electron transport complex subunit RsxA [Tissierella praeacuta]TCU71644.1 electron transport complex protein RnfA [Tissierella praeacuta]SHE27730.1 electron transport complex protein RnfA [Tissierella praeacuta DSM 18095]SUP00966.1 Electron transport complex protein rnfA [Tissierella praeacuta]
MSIPAILISTIFVNNYVLARFLGICPFLGVSNKMETATGMGAAVTFVVTLSSIITYFIHKHILYTLKLEYLQTIVFILVIAALVQFVELAMKKISPTLYNALGVYLPLITTNCVVLGVAILNIKEGYDLLRTIFNAIGSSVGFTLALVLISGIREKLELADVPEALKGFPIALITAGLMSIAFLGFNGLV